MHCRGTRPSAIKDGILASAEMLAAHMCAELRVSSSLDMDVTYNSGMLQYDVKKKSLAGLRTYTRTVGKSREIGASGSSRSSTASRRAFPMSRQASGSYFGDIPRVGTGSGLTERASTPLRT